MEKKELEKLLPEVIHNLKGSTEVQSHIIRVETGIEGEDLFSLSSSAMDQLLLQWHPELDEGERSHLLVTLQAAFTAGVLLGAKVNQRNG